MSLKQEFEEGLKDALREKDDARKRSLRMVLTNIKLAEVQKGIPLSDQEVQAVLQKEVKSLNESVVEARQVGRADLVEAAEAEISVLQAYLPQPLSREELESLARTVIKDVGETSPAEMGVVMKNLMPIVQGRADGGQVNALVRELLSES